jgi:ribosomal protein S18 acetylase RimI-like enzyme
MAPLPFLEIRRAERRDAELLGAVTERVYRAGGWAGEQYAKVLRDGQSRIDDAVVFVGLIGGTIVGTSTLALPGTRFAETGGPDETEIRMLAVDERARGRGVGNLLLEACEAHTQTASVSAVVLSTESDMHAAHRLYARRGYVHVRERDWQVNGFQLLVYRRELASLRRP